MNRFWMIALGALALIGVIAAAAMAEEPWRAPVTQRALTPDMPQQSLRGVTATSSGAPTRSSANEAANTPIRSTVKVAMLLPLTGRHSDIGRALQDAANVALFDKYAQLSRHQQGVKVELLAKDTGDSPELARSAASEAIAQGATLILGPVFADATEAVAPIAAAKNVPVLSFSNSRDRASAGVYMLGFSPAEQTFRIVNYALSHGKKRVAVLVPQSPLGDEVLTAARTAASNVGAKLVAELQYPTQAVGLEKTLAPLTPANGAAPAFDALLIAEGGPALETIIRALGSRGISQSNVQLLGTGLWDDAALRRKVNLDGAWFASSPPEMTAQFENRFLTTYGGAPPRLASLAYDAVALSVALAVTGRPYGTEALTSPTGFVGPANGLFRLKADGSTERGLAIIRIEGSNLTTLDAAAKSF